MHTHVILKRATDELTAAKLAFDAVTGEQTFPPPLSPEHMADFRKAVEKHFSKVARDMNSELQTLLPWIYGFVTPCAVVTVGVYHGHSPNVCVKLRKREAEEVLSECDERDIGLANLIAFVDPSAPPISTWEHRSYELELGALAAKLSRYGRPFLLDPNANWSGLRDWLHKKIEKSLSEMPWLNNFRTDT